jgi:hypothetical protein
LSASRGFELAMAKPSVRRRMRVFIIVDAFRRRNY